MASKVVAKVTRDSISQGEFPTRVGLEWTENEVANYAFDKPEYTEKLSFRLKDDDGEIYYGGWLIDDGEGIIQSMILAWGMHDAGCTTIEVMHRDPHNGTTKWVQEIG